ncbi:MAG: GNAT family N-acetyltransferase [Nanoarchaeota archaeon]
MALIRLAKPSDAKSVIEIIAQSSHTPNDYPNNGFVKHQNLDEWCYRRRISSTPFFYCAELLGKVVGFLAAYPLRSIWEETLNNDPLTRKLQRRYPDDVYFDQVAIRREWREKRIAQNLAHTMHQAAAMMHYGGIVGVRDYRKIICRFSLV